MSISKENIPIIFIMHNKQFDKLSTSMVDGNQCIVSNEYDKL